jgi:hypothetical protein
MERECSGDAADRCLQAAERGLAVVAIEANCEHNSRSTGLPQTFLESAKVFARKWQDKLPVATCVIIDEDRRVRVLGNSEQSEIARTYESKLVAELNRS